jgi:hypothetical protein
MRRIPRKARGRRNQFFEAEGVDELLSCVLRLMSEVSALRERQFVTERVLESRGLEVGALIESYQPTATDEAWLAAERQRFISSVLAQFQAPTGDSPAQEAEPAQSGAGRNRAA